ncbi:MAG: adenylyltransferase/cytidyltransferase family protein, partial [Acidobacteriota bacterium]|nr:adenylyltransferase/cytidyltransferase family protein [Acidobacteriota bacterium]
EGVVCAYGAFDLLHPGHVRILEQARDFGSVLAVAVQSDELVRAAAARASGHSGIDAYMEIQPPITPAAERAEIVAALRAVDAATVVDATLEEFLKLVQPDVFVCGGQRPQNAGVFRGPREPAAEMENSASKGSNELDRIVAAIGCRLVRLPIEPGYSTSRLIERISGQRA